MIDSFLDTLFIPNGSCPICKRVLFFTEAFLCSKCVSALESIKGDHYVRAVRETDDGFSAYAYEGNVKNIIHELKFSREPEFAVYMGTLLGEQLLNSPKSWLLQEADMIIPVPLHEKSLQERGYNQSEKLAEGMLIVMEKRGFSIKPSLEREILSKTKETLHQRDLGRDERLFNLLGAFEISAREKVKDRKVLLVDDVFTTGSTINVCAKALKEAGAKNVSFAVLAYSQLH